MAEGRQVSPEIGWRKQDWAYAQVREWIVSGELAPGTRIDQEELAGKIGISRIPLREALARLIAEGLLGGAPHRRLIVTAMSLSDARDVYCGRKVLESALAGEAAKRSTVVAHDLDQIERTLDRTERLLTAGDFEEFQQLDRTFHEGIYKMADMPKSFGAASSLYAMSERYVRLYMSDSDRISASYAEHVKIYQAVKAGDHVSAAELTCSHVQTGLELLETRFPE